ncbi:MAG: hypothetical protein PHT31_04700 [Candidatus Omnitrophica bacterium]|nr:hypothetical protein [Candidatus Omnitrophota bacterium]MDD5653445.1 hypothetical protein [Candidatus Omnitrophota bacterium]
MLKNNFRTAIFFVFCTFGLSFLIGADEQPAYNAKGRRDPFTPLVTSDGRLLKLDIDEKPSALRVEGLIHDEAGLSYAIVNGAIVKVGDAVAGYQILKIETNKVVFIKDGQISQIVIKKEE